MRNCSHKRVKKNFPFGRKSSPTMYCKDCKAVVKPKDIKIKPKMKRNF